ncbi:hypothetical protein Nepgr_009021 [Nepenthes gracilis]|uniref:Uncharacterized protein n=1 Tax=Nepenthes gracilis TaxID=150966 RepID=A0AAD3SA52_NEPGR|nr:hypothetical protein Nepgr_009021 [Nepenthes gracilis]
MKSWFCYQSANPNLDAIMREIESGVIQIEREDVEDEMLIWRIFDCVCSWGRIPYKVVENFVMRCPRFYLHDIRHNIFKFADDDDKPKFLEVGIMISSSKPINATEWSLENFPRL